MTSLFSRYWCLVRESNRQPPGPSVARVTESYRVDYELGTAPKRVGNNPWGEAFVLCPERLRNSAQGFNPGNRPPRATRPEGGARSNVLTRRKRGPIVQLSHVPIAHSDFWAATGASFIWYARIS